MRSFVRAIQVLLPFSCDIAGPGLSSMMICGVEAASTAKRKSGPSPINAVPFCTASGAGSIEQSLSKTRGVRVLRHLKQLGGGKLVCCGNSENEKQIEKVRPFHHWKELAYRITLFRAALLLWHEVLLGYGPLALHSVSTNDTVALSNCHEAIHRNFGNTLEATVCPSDRDLG